MCIFDALSPVRTMHQSVSSFPITYCAEEMTIIMAFTRIDIQDKHRNMEYELHQVA